jgi:hypothetical protein
VAAKARRDDRDCQKSVPIPELFFEPGPDAAVPFSGRFYDKRYQPGPVPSVYFVLLSDKVHPPSEF